MVTGKFFGFGKVISSGYDASAQAVINAIQLSDTLSTGQKDAINAVVLAKKADGTWSNGFPYYGVVGGSAAAHKWNWKDPRDLDAAFRLTFVGGWTHSSTGMQPNGTTGYARTHFVPSSHMTINSTAICIYSRTDQADGDVVDVGSLQGGTDSFGLQLKRNGTGIQSDFYDTNTPGGRLQVANASSIGYYIGSRFSGSDHCIYKAGSIIAGDGSTAGVLNGLELYIGARNLDDSPASFSNKEFASIEICGGIDNTLAAIKYTDEQTFQTALSRQV